MHSGVVYGVNEKEGIVRSFMRDDKKILYLSKTLTKKNNEIYNILGTCNFMSNVHLSHHARNLHFIVFQPKSLLHLRLVGYFSLSTNLNSSISGINYLFISFFKLTLKNMF